MPGPDDGLWDLLLSPISAVVLVLLHVLLALYRLAVLVCHLLPVSRSRRPVAAATGSQGGIEFEPRAWKKLPGHLAVVFVPCAGWSRRKEQKLAADVSRLVGWCKQLGIRTLSLYDEQGLLLAQEDRIRGIVNQHGFVAPAPGTKGLAPEDGVAGVYKSHTFVRKGGVSPAELVRAAEAAEDKKDSSSAASSTAVSSPPPEETAPAVFNLHLLSRLAGRDQLASIARDLARDPGRKKRAAGTKVSLNDIECRLRGLGPSEPDLLMVIGGSYLRLRGFPPWQIRLTELFHHTSPSWLPRPELSRAILASALDGFGGAEMRFGR